MKNKLKKFFVSLFSIMICISCCFGLFGCTEEEVKQATTAGIDASTNIIPVAYDKNIAKSTFESAYGNSIKQAGYKAHIEELKYFHEVLNEVQVMTLTFKGGMDSAYFIEDENGPFFYYTPIKEGMYGSMYYYFYIFAVPGAEPDTIDYTKWYKQCDSLEEDMLSKSLTTYMIADYSNLADKVVFGKYYQGKEHVYAEEEKDYGGGVVVKMYYDFVVKDNLISELIVSYSYSEGGTRGTIAINFEYGEQTINGLPTTLEGYEESPY